MARITVKPQHLREVSRQFSSASDESMRMIANVDRMLSALQSEWGGVTSERFYQEYQHMRSRIQQFPRVLSQIHTSLEHAALRFETADGSDGVSALTSLPMTGATAVLGASVARPVRQQYAEWQAANAERLRGMTPEKADEAIAQLKSIRKTMEGEMDDMRNPKDIGHWLMNTFTDEDEKFIQNSEGRIERIDALIAEWEERKRLMAEGAVLQSAVERLDHIGKGVAEQVPAGGYSANQNYPRGGFSGVSDSNCTWYAAQAVKTASGGEIDITEQPFPSWGNATTWAENATKYAEMNPGKEVLGVDHVPQTGDVGHIDTHVVFVESVKQNENGSWRLVLSEEQASGAFPKDNWKYQVGEEQVINGGKRWRYTLEVPKERMFRYNFIHFNYEKYSL